MPEITNIIQNEGYETSTEKCQNGISEDRSFENYFGTQTITYDPIEIQGRIPLQDKLNHSPHSDPSRNPQLKEGQYNTQSESEIYIQDNFDQICSLIERFSSDQISDSEFAYLAHHILPHVMKSSPDINMRFIDLISPHLEYIKQKIRTEGDQRIWSYQLLYTIASSEKETFTSRQAKNDLLSIAKDPIFGSALAHVHGRFYLHENNNAAIMASRCLSEYFKSLGLDPNSMFNWWMDAGFLEYDSESENYKVSYDKLRRTIERHLFRMGKLEQSHPGSVLELNRRYNIHDFGRYPINVLINQFLDKDKTGPVIKGFYAKSDPQDSLTEDFLDSFTQELTQFDPPIYYRIFEVDRGAAIGKAYEDEYQRFGPNTIAVNYNNHGTPETMELDTSIRKIRGIIHIENISEKLSQRMLKKYFIPDITPTVILNSCSTDRGIAQKIRDSAPQVKVIAPSEPVKVINLHADKDSKGKLSLRVVWKDLDSLLREHKQLLNSGTTPPIDEGNSLSVVESTPPQK